MLQVEIPVLAQTFTRWHRGYPNQMPFMKHLVRAASKSLENRRILFYVYCLSYRWDCRGTATFPSLNCFLAHYMVYLRKNLTECILNIGCFQSRSLHEVERLPFCKRLSIFCWYSNKVSEIRLISNKHDHNVGVCVISQLFQPPGSILKCSTACDIIDK